MYCPRSIEEFALAIFIVSCYDLATCEFGFDLLIFERFAVQ